MKLQQKNQDTTDAERLTLMVLIMIAMNPSIERSANILKVLALV
jgi:hypothetical protein